MRRLFIILFILAFPITAPAVETVDFVAEYQAGNPTAVAVDDEGNIYLAQKRGTIMVLDQEGNRKATWSGKTGSGREVLKSPSALAYYDGKIYVTDSSNNLVAIFSKDGEYIDSFGEKGYRKKQFDEPSGISVSARVIYVADKENDRIQLFGPNGVYIGTLGHWGARDYRTVKKPEDVDIDSLGNFYTIDGKRSVVMSLRPTGEHIVNYIGLNKPIAIAVAQDGIYIADNGDYKIIKHNLKGSRLFSFGTKGKGRAQFLEISGIAIDGKGGVYVSDIKRGTVQVFSETGELTAGNEAVAAPPTHVSWLSDIKAVSGKVHWDGNSLYSINSRKRAIDVIKDDIFDRTIKISGCDPVAVDVDTEGFLWVVDGGKDRIVKADEDGNILLTVGSSGKREGYLKDPNDIAISKEGIVYVTERGNKRVQAFNLNGVFLHVLEKDREDLFKRPVGIEISSDGRIYVVDEKNGSIVIFSPEGKVLKIFGGLGEGASKFKEPVDIAVNDDEVFVLDGDDERIAVFTAGGGYLREFASNGSGKGDFEKPVSMTIKNGAVLYVADTGNERIQSLQVEYTPSPPSGLSVESGMREIKLKWNKSSENYVGRYKIYRSENERFGFKEIARSRENSFVDEEVDPTKAYFYGVSAYTNTGNESNMSKPIRARGLKYAVSAPTGLRAYAEPDAISIEWKHDDESNVSGYVIYRKRKTESQYKELVRIEGTSYRDKEVLPDRTYEYMVSAVSIDKVESKRSEVLTFRSLPDTKIPVEIDVLEMNDIFSNTYKLYETDGVGRVRITNNTREPISDLKVLFMIKNFMDFPSEVVIEELLPKQSKEVRIKAVFNNRILNVTEDTPVQTEVKVAYYRNQEERDYSKNITLDLYEKHHLVWDVREKIVTFITPKDPVVLEFARQVVTQYTEANDPLTYASAIFDALGVLGVTYMKDPNNPYQVTSGMTDYVDYVQYPRETLKRKSGDCDDLVALYSSALESLGITTRLIDYPGHIMMMFNSGALAGDDPDLMDGMFIDKEGYLWVPVEVTNVGQSFMKAWETGSLNYAEWNGKDLQFVNIKEAWKTFKPATLANTEWRAEAVARGDIEKQYFGEFARIKKIKIRRLSRKYIERLESDPSDVSASVQLGILYAEFGMLLDARNTFKKALAVENNNAALWNNIGNIHYLEERYDDAVKAYETAASLDPKDSFVLINLSRCLLEMGLKEEAKRVFKKAFTLNRDIFKLYRKLSLELM